MMALEIPYTASTRRTVSKRRAGQASSAFMDQLESRTLFSVPAAPTSLKVTASGSSIHLQWKDQSSAETGFKVYRGTGASNMTQLNKIGKNSTTYDTNPPKLNTTYYYTVRAYNSSGDSKAATPVSIKVSASSSAVKVTSSASSSISGNVIYIGPNRSIKTLSQAKFPGSGDKPVTFVLDYSSKAYEVSRTDIHGNVTLMSADPSHKATLHLPASFKAAKNSSTFIAGDGAFKVYGSFTIKNFNITGGDNAILLGSVSGSNVYSENIHTDGGAIWKGDGVNTAVFKNSEIVGNPRGNVFGNYNGTAKNVTIDNSGTSVPIPQGGRLVGGNPIGESPIRIMNVNNLTIIGVKTKPWFYKNGQEWKQDIQIRPKSGTVKLINCTFYQPDVGDITWRKPSLTIQYVEFNNCTMTKSPNLTGGAKVVKLVNCKVAGKTVTKQLV